MYNLLINKFSTDISLGMQPPPFPPHRQDPNILNFLCFQSTRDSETLQSLIIKVVTNLSINHKTRAKKRKCRNIVYQSSLRLAGLNVVLQKSLTLRVKLSYNRGRLLRRCIKKYINVIKET